MARTHNRTQPLVAFLLLVYIVIVILIKISNFISRRKVFYGEVICLWLLKIKCNQLERGVF